MKMHFVVVRPKTIKVLKRYLVCILYLLTYIGQGIFLSNHNLLAKELSIFYAQVRGLSHIT